MDTRQHSTQDRIIDGLIQCIKEKPVREITNKDIYTKAEVTYQTFFRYYSDKNELLDDLENTLISELRTAFKKDRDILTKLKHTPNKDEMLTLTDPTFRHIFSFCDANKKILRVLLSQNGDLLFVRKLQNVAEKEFIIRAQYLSKGIELNSQDILLIKTYTTQVMTLIENWLFFSDSISQKRITEIIGEVQIISPFEVLKGKSKIE
ncbi:TetR/AcrR family transcriptional regulator [Lactobacillus helveticus]|uniref:TetR/AcrR family transcriptional regulator n=1 Tax=Lactobacillus helveticus TaxID=1587 RepID=UPI0038529C74